VTEVAFGLLGPLDIRCGGQAIAVPAARQRSLLAALLLRADQPVAKHSLCEAVWAGTVPAGAETTLRSYVMRLRRLLGPVLGGRLVARPPGYLMHLEQDDELDLLRLQGCIRRGNSAAVSGDWHRSMREFSDGLALWRGEPLCDIPSDSLHLSVVSELTEHRVRAWEGLHAAALHLGRAADLVVPLQRLTEEDPLSERLSVLLMSALAQGNRRIDALAEFRRLRRVLVAGLGVEPGELTRELHQRLLRDEGLSDLVPSRALPGPARPATAVPLGGTQILAHLGEFIQTEREMRDKAASGELRSAAEHERLTSVERALDQCWNLLRQRRARREPGPDPSGPGSPGRRTR
jgi:DNA-binding SARP family transcriptional activator